MVPLMVEEGYRADGWLGMLLGTRLWYGFCGSTTLSSEAAFEGKVEELCRELGDRGKAGSARVPVTVAVVLVPSDVVALLCDASERVSVLSDSLECTARLLPSVHRKQRQGLATRVDVLLDTLEHSAGGAEWLVAEWTAAQAESTAEAIAGVQVLGKQEGSLEPSGVLCAVTTLLSALDDVAAAHVDRQEALQSLLQCGGDEAATTLSSILEHGLSALEALTLTTPRRGRKAIDAVCEQLESALENVDETLVAQLSSCEASDLRSLCAALCAVDGLRAGEGDVGFVGIVSGALDQLEQCSDPVSGVCRLLASVEASMRARGLSVLFFYCSCTAVLLVFEYYMHYSQ